MKYVHLIEHRFIRTSPKPRKCYILDDCGKYVQKQVSTSFMVKGIVGELDIRKILLPNFTFINSSSADMNIDELAGSIQQNGLLQPIIVRIRKDRFEVVAGSRRYLACKKIGWRKIMCHIVELDDKEAYEIYLNENIHRKSLEPIEEAQAFKTYVVDFGWGGISHLANKIGKSPSYVYKRLSLLNLPDDLILSIQNSMTKISIAEELIPIRDQIQLVRVSKLVLENDLTARQTRELVKNVQVKPELSSIDNDGSIKSIDVLYRDKIIDIDTIALRSFDKSITTLKIAINNLARIIETVEDNWVVYEMLMQHKNMLNNQIDILIKEKKKL
jgi:ParB family transcriptional regulator, chromosome partitioning protein